MSILNTKTTIFIEFESILFDTDSFVLKKLYDRITEKPNSLPLRTLKTIVDKHGVENIDAIGQCKRVMNPIVDLLNDGVNDRNDLADYMYDSILYGEYYENELTELELTILGKHVHQLLIDDNLEKIYIYSKNFTDSIMNFMVEWLGHNSKIEYITGNKGKFLATIPCDAYFIANSDDIEWITELTDYNHDVRRDIFLVEYEFNMENGGVKCPVGTPAEIKEKFNIEIASVAIPIV